MRKTASSKAMKWLLALFAVLVAAAAAVLVVETRRVERPSVREDAPASPASAVVAPPAGARPASATGATASAFAAVPPSSAMGAAAPAFARPPVAPVARPAVQAAPTSPGADAARPFTGENTDDAHASIPLAVEAARDTARPAQERRNALNWLQWNGTGDQIALFESLASSDPDPTVRGAAQGGITLMISRFPHRAP